MSQWVTALGGTKTVNLDTVAYVQVQGSGTTWWLSASDGGGTLDGTYTSQADAAEALRNLVNAVPVSDLI